MERFAIGVADFFNNVLDIYIIEEKTWRDAIIKCMQDRQEQAWLEELPHTEEDVKEYFFNGDMLIGWKEIDDSFSPYL